MKLPSFEQSLVGFLLVSASSFAQDVRIHGKVVDEYTKEPIPMVNVFVRGRSIGATTDSLGVFSLSLVAEKNAVVSFSHIGYWKQSYDLELRQKEDVTFTVELEPRTIGLSGITVTAWRRPEDMFARVITEKYIEQYAPHTLSDLLQISAPIVLNSTGWGRGPESILYPPSHPNFILFWNGMEIDPYDLDLIDPYSIEKILIWHGMEAPINYITRSRQFLPRGGADILPKIATSSYGFPPYVIEIQTK